MTSCMDVEGNNDSAQVSSRAQSRDLLQLAYRPPSEGDPSTALGMTPIMIRAHVCPVRGPSVPRAVAGPAVFRPDGRPAGKVRRELPRAGRMVPPSAGAA